MRSQRKVEVLYLHREEILFIKLKTRIFSPFSYFLSSSYFHIKITSLPSNGSHESKSRFTLITDWQRRSYSSALKARSLWKWPKVPDNTFCLSRCSSARLLQNMYMNDDCLRGLDFNRQTFLFLAASLSRFTNSHRCSSGVSEGFYFIYKL